MKASTPGWIGFFDLLGTKDSSKIRRDELPDKISLFNSRLVGLCRNAKANVSLRYFSDSAYIFCDDAVVLLDVCRKLRWSLFAEEIFFKAALVDGSLEEKPYEKKIPVKSGDSSFVIDIKGASFGPSVVGAYEFQEAFKGIGFRVEGDWPDSARKQLVSTCFPSPASNRSWVTVRDINFSEREIGGTLDGDEIDAETRNKLSFFDSLLSAAMRANSSKSNLGRYYLSCLMTVVQSSDFGSLDFADGLWKKRPLVLYHMLENRQRTECYLNIKGSEAIYFAIAQKILEAKTDAGVPRYKDGTANSVCDGILRFLYKRKLLSNAFPELPKFALDKDMAHEIARRLTRIRLG